MHTQFYPPSQSQNPQSKIACAATTRHGLPCHGPALAHSLFCAFHDPDHAATIAAGRSRGGAAPRRRLRRLPRRLDYLHVAELTGELFVDALNHADPADPRSLRAVSQLARVLLQAVGRPKDSFVPPAGDAEPEAEAPHLLRVYPPLPPTVEALLAAEALASAARSPAPPSSAPAPDLGGHADYSFVPDQPTELWEEQSVTWPDALAVAPPAPELTPDQELDPAPAPGPHALPGADPDLAPAPDPLDGPHPEPEAGRPVEQHGGQRPEQGAEQGMDRHWTGPLATENYAVADPVPHAASLTPQPSGAPDTGARTPAEGLTFALPRCRVYLRPRPRDPFG
jgi:hypothetical protein